MNETVEEAELATSLVALSHHVLQLFSCAGRAHKLTQQQVELMCAVIVRGRVRMTDLGKLMVLEKSSLSNLVDRLERRGLAVRTRDPDDRRATWVELTSEGTELAMRTHREVTARLDGLINRLPSKDQRRLSAVVRTLMAEENP
ncbi:MarR family winged helix-turn-helix transcriptional regulator [Actinopolymorpha alba]|uniref:MarR family winged helix-turn-helix transcriptional regulator n=1 Tax=Actinopolymorpha alba TaxID=533267 RepID=UPI0003672C32|nr:MarR family transcriptional regulator [Actinopolymorpha alba]